MLITASHVDLRMDRHVAYYYPEVDLIAGGHSHDYLPKGEKVNKTWVIQTGEWGQHIGDIAIQLNDDHQVVSIVPNTVKTADLLSSESDQAKIDA